MPIYSHLIDYFLRANAILLISQKFLGIMTFKPFISFTNVTAAILIITVTVLGVKLYETKIESKNLAHNLNLDKKVHNNEINEILIRYDSALSKNQKLAKEIEMLKSKNVSIDSVEVTYQSSLNLLKDNISTLKKEEHSKSKQLETLNSILRLKQQDFESNKREIEKLNAKISRLESEIRPASDSKMEKRKLKAINVNAIGARIVSEKILETKKIKSTEQIKVCFTLEENATIEKGSKEIFIQIINPKANIVSRNAASVEIRNQTLFYSAKTNVNYEKDNVDVCVFVDAKKENLVKGNYIVNIFSGASLIGNTNLSLL